MRFIATQNHFFYKLLPTRAITCVGSYACFGQCFHTGDMTNTVNLLSFVRGLTLNRNLGVDGRIGTSFNTDINNHDNKIGKLFMENNEYNS